jgi:transcriptional regulator with XRE-family HTH domain
MTGDWAAVATAVQRRMAELGLSQGDVIKRSGLSKQTVGEIENNSEQRNRGRNTMESLSKGLGLHPDYLAAVLVGRTPPELGEPFALLPDDFPARFDVLEHRINRMRDELVKEIEASIEDRFVDLRKEMLAGIQLILIRLQQAGR